jgi:peptidoglycan/LPS O-acetylase OafA/YrhL
MSSRTVRVAGLVLAAVLFAFLFYRIIEKPALKWAKAIRYSRGA